MECSDAILSRPVMHIRIRLFEWIDFNSTALLRDVQVHEEAMSFWSSVRQIFGGGSGSSGDGAGHTAPSNGGGGRPGGVMPTGFIPGATWVDHDLSGQSQAGHPLAATGHRTTALAPGGVGASGAGSNGSGQAQANGQAPTAQAPTAPGRSWPRPAHRRAIPRDPPRHQRNRHRRRHRGQARGDRLQPIRSRRRIGRTTGRALQHRPRRR